MVRCGAEAEKSHTSYILERRACLYGFPRTLALGNSVNRGSFAKVWRLVSVGLASSDCSGPESLVPGATFEQPIPPAALLCVRWCLQTPRGRSVGAVRFSPSPIDLLSFGCGINGASQTIPRIALLAGELRGVFEVRGLAFGGVVNFLAFFSDAKHAA